MTSEGKGRTRRDVLKQIMGLPVLGGLGGGLASLPLMREEEHLLHAEEAGQTTSESENNAGTTVDGTSGATRKSWEQETLATLKKPVPRGKIGNLEVSRLILGGNLIGGWAHSRDLIYVSELIKRYHTKERVFKTFWMAEECGINTFMGNPVLYPMMAEYFSEAGGEIQFISDCGGSRSMLDNMQEAIDNGCAACYIHGGMADSLVASSQYDEIARAFEVVRKNGIPVGLGAHQLSTVQGAVEHGIIPDFWMKTYHHGNYWSAKNPSEHDNIFCHDPEAVREFMAARTEPWIAFKVLAAGAIEPADGFRYAYEGGADFVCVGMYDFQLTNDSNICVDILESSLDRQRAWA